MLFKTTPPFLSKFNLIKPAILILNFICFNPELTHAQVDDVMLIKLIERSQDKPNIVCNYLFEKAIAGKLEASDKSWDMISKFILEQLENQKCNRILKNGSLNFKEKLYSSISRKPFLFFENKKIRSYLDGILMSEKRPWDYPSIILILSYYNPVELLTAYSGLVDKNNLGDIEVRRWALELAMISRNMLKWPLFEKILLRLKNYFINSKRPENVLVLDMHLHYMSENFVPNKQQQFIERIGSLKDTLRPIANESYIYFEIQALANQGNCIQAQNLAKNLSLESYGNSKIMVELTWACSSLENTIKQIERIKHKFGINLILNDVDMRMIEFFVNPKKDSILNINRSEWGGKLVRYDYVDFQILCIQGIIDSAVNQCEKFYQSFPADLRTASLKKLASTFPLTKK